MCRARPQLLSVRVLAVALQSTIASRTKSALDLRNAGGALTRGCTLTSPATVMRRLSATPDSACAMAPPASLILGCEDGSVVAVSAQTLQQIWRCDVAALRTQALSQRPQGGDLRHRLQPMLPAIGMSRPRTRQRSSSLGDHGLAIHESSYTVFCFAWLKLCRPFNINGCAGPHARKGEGGVQDLRVCSVARRAPGLVDTAQQSPNGANAAAPSYPQQPVRSDASVQLPDRDFDQADALSSTQPAGCLVAVSRRGGHIDVLCVLASQRHGQALNAATPTAAQHAREGEALSSAQEHCKQPSAPAASMLPPPDARTAGLSNTELAVAQDCSADGVPERPRWLLELQPPAPPSTASRLERQNLWLPLCWLPCDVTEPARSADGTARASARLVAGGHGGGVSAWDITLPAEAWLSDGAAAPGAVAHGSTSVGAAQNERHSVPGSSRADAGSAADKWARPARRAPSASWAADRTAPRARAAVVQLQPKHLHSSTLFSMHAALSVATAADPVAAANTLQDAQSSSEHSRAPTLQLWTTSLDRKVAVWQATTSEVTEAMPAPKQVSAHLTIRAEAAWHCTGAPVSAICAVRH